MTDRVDVLVVGTGPAGLSAVFSLLAARHDLSVAAIDSSGVSTGGLCNDCKMNFTFPVGFPEEYWTAEQAAPLLGETASHLVPSILPTRDVAVYTRRAERLGVRLLEVRQSHLGTDGGVHLAHELVKAVEDLGAAVSLHETLLDVRAGERVAVTDRREIPYKALVVAPGRRGFAFLQSLMDRTGIPYVDNVVDIGLRLETREANYPVVRDYYDPKFLFPDRVRTFCTNSGDAHVVKEKYAGREGREWFSLNGHAFSSGRGTGTGLVNFAVLKTVRLTAPLASGQEYAEMLGQLAMVMGGGQPLMQRVGDFRLGKRSRAETFTGDLYDFAPTLASCTPGDVSLAMPAKILRAIWKSMKLLDTIVPGVLHPSTIMYWPEIKLYANRPCFIDDSFQAAPGIWLIGDGAGTSRGITAAWASGIRAAHGILAAL
ncbi:MAG: pyridine nucleotide-disulfide oxidoreductase [Spirochaetes bacterium]|nr:pyridine nucleotide-disulfide oxidoreductase [Spirochaetota bacterium]